MALGLCHPMVFAKVAKESKDGNRQPHTCCSAILGFALQVCTCVKRGEGRGDSQKKEFVLFVALPDAARRGAWLRSQKKLHAAASVSFIFSPSLRALCCSAEELANSQLLKLVAFVEKQYF